MKLNIKEEETFSILKQDYPDIRKHNRKEVLREAINWLYESDNPTWAYPGHSYWEPDPKDDYFEEFCNETLCDLDFRPEFEWRVNNKGKFQVREKDRSSRLTYLGDWSDWHARYGSEDYWRGIYYCGKFSKVPDGIRIIKMELKDEEMWRHTKEGWRKRDYIIQFWEIENTFQVTQDKLDSYGFWTYIDLDPYEYGAVEVWRCDKWGDGRRQLFTSVGSWPYKGYDSYEDYDRLYNYQQPRF